ncbi:methyltransferase domain-containing protein [Phytopseudomonas dryadis]|uniref:SAM-dependent methyltransferase n=1 Tax=Phytopseudomonas dryadis TaxID=2487520 RepID=A0A4Q9R3X6_9GAMM|nr:MULTISPECIES: methyltransferase domain-containing protein [Pseudomonas]TBU94476.1 SAM-dependent methyltransferase [Pseudomonas dryadis]TBV05925.1 SAM-dependent methyltransferase [Pseudomonas dryadis]TBV18067.1 SAM-dependent methyltransferase [Pseudomonas sp. FRB 230]
MKPASARPFSLFALSLGMLSLLQLPGALAQTPALDVPYVPTPEPVVARMLEMADVGPDDYVIDLGSGDGRIAISAVRDRGAKSAYGIDLNPERIEEAERNAEQAGVSDKVSFEQGDLFKKDISEANVLTMYLLSTVNMRLRPVILDTLEPGTRVVSHAFSMEDWEPDRSDIVGGARVYLWIVPAKVAGSWRVEADGESFNVELTQRFQEVAGSTESQQAVRGRLNGNELRFTVNDKLYVGQIEGDRINAVSAEGAVAGWSAQRS